jgi:cysteine desulfurase/selenocysteine lyase
VHQEATRGIDWKAIREDFPILREQAHGHPLIYFDSAATTQKPRSVLDALQNYYEHQNANVHRGLHYLSSRATEAYERSRQRAASYLGAPSADEIVFTRGTTESINLVAQAWGGKFLLEDDVILLTEMEHHSNLVPWQLLAERIGARLRFVPVRDDGTLALDRLPCSRPKSNFSPLRTYRTLSARSILWSNFAKKRAP